MTDNKSSNLVAKGVRPMDLHQWVRHECEVATPGCIKIYEADAVNAKLERLRAALVGAVEVIQTWHNMPLGTGRLPSNAWDIYWRNAPEMKPIREALSNSVETKP